MVCGIYKSKAKMGVIVLAVSTNKLDVLLIK